MRKLLVKVLLYCFKCVGRFYLFRFRKHLSHPEKSQIRLLRALLKDLAQTEYGKSHGITGNETYEEFAAMLPVSCYDQLSELISRQINDETAILTSKKYTRIERTSGSSGPCKVIPYNKEVLGSFKNMFLIWLGDLLLQFPTLKSGRTYISISAPVETKGREERCKNTDDKDYLPAMMKKLSGLFFIPPPGPCINSEEFTKKTVCSLLSERELEVISVWSPGFLTVLIDYIISNRQSLATDLSLGKDVKILLEKSGLNFLKLWPHLKLISCWSTQSTRKHILKIEAHFPGISIQGKGLLATEAPMTVPLSDTRNPVPLIQEVFFEFKEINTGNIYPVWKIKQGKIYEIIITQKAGLFRYAIGDRVQTVGLAKKTPCLQFINRGDATSDLAGEKLNESFVQNTVNEIGYSVNSHYLLLANTRADTQHYMLIIDRIFGKDNLEKIGEQFEEMLKKSYHYNLARFQGQLGKSEIVCDRSLTQNYYAYFESKGMRRGDIKLRNLLSHPHDYHSFYGHGVD